MNVWEARQAFIGSSVMEPEKLIGWKSEREELRAEISRLHDDLAESQAEKEELRLRAKALSDRLAKSVEPSLAQSIRLECEQREWRRKIREGHERESRQALLVHKLQNKVVEYRTRCQGLERQLVSVEREIQKEEKRIRYEHSDTLESTLIKLEEEQQRSVGLVDMNSLLRSQLSQAGEANDVLREDLSKLTADWSRVMEEAGVRETEWQKEKELLTVHIGREHGRLLTLWRGVVTLKRQCQTIRSATDRDLWELRAEFSHLSTILLSTCASLNLPRMSDIKSSSAPTLPPTSYSTEVSLSIRDLALKLREKEEELTQMKLRHNAETQELRDRILELSVTLQAQEEQQKEREQERKREKDREAERERERKQHDRLQRELESIQQGVLKLCKALSNRYHTMGSGVSEQGLAFLLNVIAQAETSLIFQQQGLQEAEVSIDRLGKEKEVLNERISALEKEKEVHESSVQRRMQELKHTQELLYSERDMVKTLQSQLEAEMRHSNETRKENERLRRQREREEEERADQERERLRRMEADLRESVQLCDREKQNQLELRSLRIALEKEQLDRVRAEEEATNVRDALLKAREEELALSASETKLKREVAESRDAMEKMAALNEALACDKRDLNAQILQLETQLGDARSLLQSLSSEVATLHRELKIVSQETADLKVQRAADLESLLKMGEKERQLESEVERLKEKQDSEAALLNEEQESHAKRLEELAELHSAACKELWGAQAELGQVLEQLRRTERERDDLLRESERTGARIQALEREREELGEEREELRSRVVSLQQQLAQTQEHLTGLELHNSQMELELKTLLQTKEVLQGEIQCLRAEMTEQAVQKAEDEQEEKEKTCRDRESMQTKMVSLQIELEHAAEQLRTVEEERANEAIKWQKEREALSSELGHTDGEMAALRHQTDGLQKQIENLSSHLKAQAIEMENILAQHGAELRAQQSKTKEANSNAETWKMRASEAEKLHEEFTFQMKEKIQAEKDELIAKEQETENTAQTLRKNEEDLRKRDEEIGTLRDKVHALEMDIEKLRHELQEKEALDRNVLVLKDLISRLKCKEQDHQEQKQEWLRKEAEYKDKIIQIRREIDQKEMVDEIREKVGHFEKESRSLTRLEVQNELLKEKEEEAINLTKIVIKGDETETQLYQKEDELKKLLQRCQLLDSLAEQLAGQLKETESALATEKKLRRLKENELLNKIQNRALVEEDRETLRENAPEAEKRQEILEVGRVRRLTHEKARLSHQLSESEGEFEKISRLIMKRDGEIEEAIRTRDELQKVLSKKDMELQNLVSQLEEQQVEVEKLRTKVNELQQGKELWQETRTEQVQKLMQQIVELEGEKDHLTSQLKKKEQEPTTTKNEADKWRLEREKAILSLKRTEEELKDEREKTELLVTQLATLREEVIELMAAKDSAKAELKKRTEQVQKFMQQIVELEGERDHLTSQLKRNEQESTIVKDEADKLRIERDKVISSLKRTEVELKDEREKTALMVTQLSTLREEVSELMTARDSAKAELKKKTEQVQKFMQQIVELERERDHLTSQLKRKEQESTTTKDEADKWKVERDKAVLSFKRTEEELKNEREKTALMVTQLSTLREEVSELMSARHSDKAELNKRMEQVQKLMQQLVELEGQRDHLTSHLKKKEQESTTMKDEADKWKVESNKAILSFKRTEEVLKDEREKTAMLVTQLTTLREEVTELMIARDSTKEELKKRIEQVQKLMQQIVELEGEKDHLTFQLRKKVQESTTTKDEADKWRIERDMAVLSLKRTEEELKYEREKTALLVTQLAALREEITELMTARDSAKVELKKKTEEVQKLMQQIVVLEGERDHLTSQLKKKIQESTTTKDAADKWKVERDKAISSLKTTEEELKDEREKTALQVTQLATLREEVTELMTARDSAKADLKTKHSECHRMHEDLKAGTGEILLLEEQLKKTIYEREKLKELIEEEREYVAVLQEKDVELKRLRENDLKEAQFSFEQEIILRKKKEEELLVNIESLSLVQRELEREKEVAKEIEKQRENLEEEVMRWREKAEYSRRELERVSIRLLEKERETKEAMQKMETLQKTVDQNCIHQRQITSQLEEKQAETEKLNELKARVKELHAELQEKSHRMEKLGRLVKELEEDRDHLAAQMRKKEREFGALKDDATREKEKAGVSLRMLEEERDNLISELRRRKEDALALHDEAQRDKKQREETGISLKRKEEELKEERHKSSFMATQLTTLREEIIELISAKDKVREELKEKQKENQQIQDNSLAGRKVIASLKEQVEHLKTLLQEKGLETLKLQEKHEELKHQAVKLQNLDVLEQELRSQLRETESVLEQEKCLRRQKEAEFLDKFQDLAMVEMERKMRIEAEKQRDGYKEEFERREQIAKDKEKEIDRVTHLLLEKERNAEKTMRERQELQKVIYQKDIQQESLTSQLVEHQVEVQGLKTMLHEMKRGQQIWMEEKGGRLEKLDKQVKELVVERDHLASELRRKEQETMALKDEADRRKRDIDKAESSLRQLNEELKMKKEKMGATENELEAMKKNVDELSRSLDRVKAEVEEREAENQKIRKGLKAGVQEMATLKVLLQESNCEGENLRVLLKEKKEELLKSRDWGVRIVWEEVEELRARARVLEQENHELKAELQLVKEYRNEEIEKSQELQNKKLEEQFKAALEEKEAELLKTKLRMEVLDEQRRELSSMAAEKTYEVSVLNQSIQEVKNELEKVKQERTTEAAVWEMKKMEWEEKFHLQHMSRKYEQAEHEKVKEALRQLSLPGNRKEEIERWKMRAEIVENEMKRILCGTEVQLDYQSGKDRLRERVQQFLLAQKESAKLLKERNLEVQFWKEKAEALNQDRQKMQVVLDETESSLIFYQDKARQTELHMRENTVTPPIHQKEDLNGRQPEDDPQDSFEMQARLKAMHQAVARLEFDQKQLKGRNAQLEKRIQRLRQEREQLKEALAQVEQDRLKMHHQLSSSATTTRGSSRSQDSITLDQGEEELIKNLKAQVKGLEAQVRCLRLTLALDHKEREEFIDKSSRNSQWLISLRQDLNDSLAVVSQSPLPSVFEAETLRLDRSLRDEALRLSIES